MKIELPAKRKGPTLLLRPSSSLAKAEAVLKHLSIGTLRHFQSSAFATVRIIHDGHEPPSYHSIALELPALPIVFPPKVSAFEGKEGPLSTVVRLEGSPGRQLQAIYDCLLHAAASAVAANNDVWKSLAWPTSQPRPTTESLLSWAKSAIMPDLLYDGQMLLRFRFPGGPKTFLLKDERTIMLEDGREPDEPSLCSPHSLLSQDRLEGYLLVSDLWIQQKRPDADIEETEDDAIEPPLRWGLTLTAKELTVKPPLKFDQEELWDKAELMPLEDW